MAFGNKLTSLARKLRRPRRQKRSRNNTDETHTSNPVDVTFNSVDESHHDRGDSNAPIEESFEVAPHHAYTASLLDLEDEADDDSNNVVPPGSIPNLPTSRRAVNFGITEHIGDGKSNFSMRVILKGTTAPNPVDIPAELCLSEDERGDLIGLVVVEDDTDDNSVQSDISNISGTTQLLPPVTHLPGRTLVFDQEGFDRADDGTFELKEDLSISPQDEDDSFRDEASTLAHGVRGVTDADIHEETQERCMFCIVPTSAVISTTTCAAVAAMTLL